MSPIAGGRHPSAPALASAGLALGTTAAVTAAAEVSLVPWSLPAARRLLSGAPPEPLDRSRWHPDYPTADTVAALATALGAWELDGPLASAPPWWVYQIRLEEQVVGDIGWHGPPAADGPRVVEIGYAVVPALRGRGIATRACRLLLEQVWAAGADTVLADAEPGNPASRTVLSRCGFTARPDGGFGLDRPDRLPIAPPAPGSA